MGTSLTAIPMDDLQNIIIKDVEIVEAFGLIRSIENKPKAGFDENQLKLLAQKVRQEWPGKNPKTYSEYDLKAMGEILCYFNASDLKEIQPVAFKYNYLININFYLTNLMTIFYCNFLEKLLSGLVQ